MSNLIKGIIKRIKEMYHHLSLVYDFKKLAIQYPIFMVFYTFLFWHIGAGVLSWWWIAPTIVTLLPFIVLIGYWLIVIKPMIRETERELKRRKKYSWMYERFTKHER